jgi:hypothetical protein
MAAASELLEKAARETAIAIDAASATSFEATSAVREGTTCTINCVANCIAV